MINNLPSIDSSALKIQAARQVYLNQKIQKKTLNLIFAKQDFLFKILASQVLALAEQDNLNPVGQKFNVIV